MIDLNVSLTLEELGMVLNYFVNNHNANEAESYNIFKNYWLSNGKNKNAVVSEINWNTILETLNVKTVDETTLLEIMLECKVFIQNL